MNGIIYLVGLIVIIMFILSFLGLRGAAGSAFTVSDRTISVPRERVHP
jgi:amino acid transporter